MFKKIFIALMLTLVLFSPRANAQNLCSNSGYTILLINGVFTDKKETVDNTNKLRKLLPTKYRNETVYVDYLYNPSHLGGVGDIVDSILQSTVESLSDYDLREMLDEASEKTKTKKLLLVGYSQGGFYINNLFDRVANKNGGVPESSIGTYAVATPDDHVSNGGGYLTSDTDKVISEVVRYFKRTMPPNTHIDLKAADGNGHSFSNVYLKYKSDKIVSDIKSSLEKLKTNDVQDKNSVCISPQPESTVNKVIDVFLPVVDYVIDKQVNTVISLYNKVKSKFNSLKNLVIKSSPAAVILADVNSEESNMVAETIDVVEQTDDNLEEDNDDIAENIPNPRIVLEENITNLEVVKDEDIVKSSNNSGHSSRSSSMEEDEDDNSGTNIEDDTEQGGNNDDEEEEEESDDFGNDNEQDDDEEVTEEGDSEDEEDDNSADEDNEENSDDSSNYTEDETHSYVYNYLDAESFFSFEDENFKIDLIGNKIVTLNVGSSYKEEGVDLLNKNDLGDIKYYVEGKVDTSKVGVYILRYYGYTNNLYRVYIMRVVNVIDPLSKDKDDKIPPVVKLVGDSYVKAVRHKGGYIEEGANSLDNKDGELPVVISETYNEPSNSEQKIAYISSDKSGNLSIKVRNVLTVDNMYIPKYDFGTGNGDGNDWKAWFFDGSTIFDWSNKYINNYLRQEFKIEAQPYAQFSCLNCVKRGIFTTNPLEGFNNSEFLGSTSLLGNPQNRHNGQIYQVVIQWDATGYTTTVSHGDIVDSSTYSDVSNVNESMWVGWCSSESSFKEFPMGVWAGINQFSQTGLRGGYSMVLMPYQVYDPDATNYEEDDSEDDDESENGTGGEENTDLPLISNFSLNDATSEITINPIKNNLSINLVSNKNVDWVSMKIENSEDSSLYKIFFSNSDTCVDGTNTCSRIWGGEISGEGKTLIDGIYKVKVHIKDEAGLEFEDYISAQITVTGQYSEGGAPPLQ